MDFPFVPVIAATFPRNRRYPSSSSPSTGTPAAARAETGSFDPRDARRQHDERRPGNVRLPHHSPAEGDLLRDRLSERFLDGFPRPVVQQQDPRPLSREEARREQPGPAGPDHHDPFPRQVLHGHRIFSVLIASSARMIDMIQNRTMTLGSAHPFSSKWWWSGAIRKIRLRRVL